jgi:hypothetical protein
MLEILRAEGIADFSRVVISHTDVAIDLEIAACGGPMRGEPTSRPLTSNMRALRVVVTVQGEGSTTAHFVSCSNVPTHQIPASFASCRSPQLRRRSRNQLLTYQWIAPDMRASSR